MLKYKWYRFKWWLSKYCVLKYPIHVDFELASVCNLKCDFCPQCEKEVDFNKGFMPFELFKKCIDEIEGKVPSIKLNLRGEPTLHPEFDVFLNYVKGKFIDIRLNTNGNYKVELNELIAEVFTKVSFSIDACDQFTYTTIRKGGRWELLLENIVKLTELNPTIIEFSFVVTDKTKADITGFKTLKRIYNPKAKLFIRPAMDRTKNLAMRDRKKAIGRKNCFMPNRRLVVAQNGEVYPCCVMWQKPFIILGDAWKENLLDIWKGSAIAMLRARLENSTAFTYLWDTCKKCDSAESYIWEE